MLIVLPPSEGKTAPAAGPLLDMSSLLGAHELRAARSTVVEALNRLGDGDEAAKVLGLGPRSRTEASANLLLTQAACSPAHDLYTGVLYEAARLAELGDSVRSRAVLASSVIILSGLWGAVRATDMLPDHRLSMGVRLPGVGHLAAYWKPPLRAVLEESAALNGGLVVDCRSGAYAPAWQPERGSDLEVVRVRAEVLRPDGTRHSVSHQAKRTRGELTGALLQRLAGPEDHHSVPVEHIAETAAGLHGVLDVELSARDGRGRRDLTALMAQGGAATTARA